ncbi:MAG: methylmalonyl Co-A mutase-associated GTPase MeaB [Actinomycetota bacterium]|nr:methylmalonyl Co-A mutase-associated GTPase MeaB [Actinomycetota bacterium]
MTAPLADRVAAGDRRALAQAITLVESTRADHRGEARALLDELLPRTGGSVRIGLSGAPGAGKSTFIEALGLHAVDAGHQVAVLAVDPSSSRSGGSVLGDKTRMSDLGRRAEAFIRPSPSGGTLGGVARRTREALLVCEAAGFDIVLVETVGVGQSEIAVADLVDLFVLVAAPGGGDELQGIKRGIMELADVVVVNKADGDLLPAAQRAASDLRKALHLVRPKRPGWEVPVLLASSLEGDGVVDAWEAITSGVDRLRGDGSLDAQRVEQAVAWMWSEVQEELVGGFRSDPAVRKLLPEIEAELRAGSRSPASAAQALLDARGNGPRHDQPGQ